MKKIVLFIASLVLLASCSVKTNEEKARELIEPQVKANLIKPESYEYAQMQLDSCFSDSQQNPELVVILIKVAELWKEYKDYSFEIERAETSMSIHAPSYGYQSAYDKQWQKRYKSEMEKAKRKAADAKDKIIQLFKDNKELFINTGTGKHEFIGWMAVIDYRAETAGGMKTMGEGLFYLNKDLTKITYRLTESEMTDIMKVMKAAEWDDIKYEFEDELKDIFAEE